MTSRKLKVSIEEQKAMIEYLDWLDAARLNGVVKRGLLKYYEDDLDNFYTVKFNGEDVTLPVFTKKNWLDLDGGLNDYLNNVSHSRATNYHSETIAGIAQEMYVRKRGKEHWNEPAFFTLENVLWNGGASRVSGLDEDNVSVSVEETDFYSYVSVQERLLREFHSALQSKSITQPQELDSVQFNGSTHHRDKIAASFEDVMDWDNHIHKVSPVCLLAIEQEGGGPIVYFVQRSLDVLHEPNAISTVPAGEVNPDSYSSVDFEQSIVREFVEELFGVTYERQPELGENSEIERRMRSHVSSGSISIERTSFGLVADAPRPCFSGLVYVSDPSVGQWIRHQLQTNWEISQLRRVELPLDGVPEVMKNRITSTPGLFTFIEGLRRLEKKGADTGLELELQM